jgi:oxalate decarboxylase/phosphoglucose isomerase-like protein (cupin superfamily)
MKKINIEVTFSDSRGEITDLIENEVINAVTLVTLRTGAIRGNHYHTETSQWNYLVSGEVEYVYRDRDGETIENSVMLKGDLILTPPGEHHALVGLSDSELLVFTKGPRGGKEYESDTIRLEQPLRS